MLRRSVQNISRVVLLSSRPCRYGRMMAALGPVVNMSTTIIQMPELMNAKNGSLDKWVKQEGDPFDKGEMLAELTLGGITIGLQLKESGILAKRILTEGEVANVGDDLAIVVDSQDAYDAYILAEQKAEEAAAAALEAAEAKKHTPNSINILRHIKHMIQLGLLKDETEFVVSLLALAQDENKQLMDLFESSYDGSVYNEDTFDNHFFIENVEIMIDKLEEQEKNRKEQEEDMGASSLGSTTNVTGASFSPESTSSSSGNNGEK